MGRFAERSDRREDAARGEPGMPSASGRTLSPRSSARRIEAVPGWRRQANVPVPSHARPARNRRRGSGGRSVRSGTRFASSWNRDHRQQVILHRHRPDRRAVRRPDQHHERCARDVAGVERAARDSVAGRHRRDVPAGGSPRRPGRALAALRARSHPLVAARTRRHARIRELMWKYRGRRMDFADAAVVLSAERDGIDTVLPAVRLGQRRYVTTISERIVDM